MISGWGAPSFVQPPNIDSRRPWDPGRLTAECSVDIHQLLTIESYYFRFEHRFDSEAFGGIVFRATISPKLEVAMFRFHLVTT